MDSVRAYCRKCGREMPADAAFCPKCGTPVLVHPAGPTVPAPVLAKKERNWWLIGCASLPLLAVLSFCAWGPFVYGTDRGELSETETAGEVALRTELATVLTLEATEPSLMQIVVPTVTLASGRATEPTPTAEETFTPVSEPPQEPMATLEPTTEPTPTLNTPPGKGATVLTTGNVRSKPTTEGSVVLGQIQPGDVVELRLRHTGGDWYSVATVDNLIGWVHHTILEVPESAAAAVLGGDMDYGVPDIQPTEVVAVEPTPEPALVAAPAAAITPYPGMPEDDFKAYLIQAYGSVGNEKLNLESVDITIADDNFFFAAYFWVDTDSAIHLTQEVKTEDLEAWGRALLADLKQQWPEQYVMGNLGWSYYTFDYREDTDCGSQLHQSLTDEGWHSFLDFVHVSYKPGGEDSIRTCFGQ